MKVETLWDYAQVRP